MTCPRGSTSGSMETGPKPRSPCSSATAPVRCRSRSSPTTRSCRLSRRCSAAGPSSGSCAARGSNPASGQGCPAPARRSCTTHGRERACCGCTRARREAYAKVYPREEDATAAAEARCRRTGQVGVRGDDGGAASQVLTVSAALRTTVLESLRPAGSSGGGRARARGPEETARALRAFHVHVPTGRLARVPASEHVNRVRREQELVATAWPDVAERVDATVRTAASVLEAFEPLAAEPVLCHGDFTPGQLVRVRWGLGPPGPRHRRAR